MKICILALLIILAYSKKDHWKRSTSDKDIRVKETSEGDSEVYIPNPNSILDPENGAEVLQMLVNDENMGVPYAILFHSGETDSYSEQRVSDYEMALRQQILDHDSSFMYLSVDAT